jgi:hypothetical protein
MDVVFFPNHKVKLQQYVKYFTDVNLINPSDVVVQTGRDICVLAHATGIIDALKWCKNNKVSPKIIVSLDGSALINVDDLSSIDLNMYNLCLFRQEWKRQIKDITYKQAIYYSGYDNHPYRDKKIYDMILKMLS